MDLTTSPPYHLKRRGTQKGRDRKGYRKDFVNKNLLSQNLVSRFTRNKNLLSQNLVTHTVRNKKILFVCTGNSCRSPVAAGFLREMLKGKEGMRIDSCGTIFPSLSGPTPQAIKIMKEYGIDISSHKTKSLSEDLIDEADLILVMERKHRERVQELNPEAGNRTFLLKEFAGDKGNLEIRDPIGLSDEVYREVAGEVKSALEKALPSILKYITRTIRE